MGLVFVDKQLHKRGASSSPFFQTMPEIRDKDETAAAKVSAMAGREIEEYKT
jgi:hypothetical protein